MQKKIIALAVAGLVSGVAFAQSNVTIYGVVDGGYTYSKSDSPIGKLKFSGIKDGVDNGINGSRVGFKGEEALGNGLKAIFLVELRVNAVNGEQTNPTRQSFVGLNSAMAGTFTIGRQYSAAGDVYGNNSSNAVTTINPVNVFQGVGGSQIVSAGGNSRQSNALKWVSPNWSGFTTRVSYAYGNSTNPASTTTAINDASETTDNGRWALSADYTNGPLNVDLILAQTSNAYLTGATANSFYGNTNSTPTAAAQVDTTQGSDIGEWYIGAAYDFKVVKLYGSYQEMKNKNDNALAITKSKMWQVGLRVPVGNGRVNLEYADIGFKEGNFLPAAGRFEGHNKGFGLGYEYDFSKRTTAYAYISQLKYDSDTAQAGGLAFVGGASPGTAVAGETQKNMSVGIRHFF